jgi:hypothetical protein
MIFKHDPQESLAEPIMAGNHQKNSNFVISAESGKSKAVTGILLTRPIGYSLLSPALAATV